MESIERLENVLNGEPVDRPPFSFWHHFGLQHMDGQAVASVHIAFARRFQTDFVKVMNDYPYPIRDGLSLDRMTDILQMRPLRGIEGSWSHQLLALEKIHTALGKEKWIVDTVYSPWTILGRLFGVDNVIKTAGSRPEIIKHGLDVITTSLINYISEASPYINGIYFSLTEADYSQFNPFEHYKICFPYNQAILEAAENKMRELKKKPFNILRLKGHRVFFESVKGYSSAAASWEHFRTRPGLAKGLLAWKRPILGGIDGETLHHGTPASIRERFEKYSVEYLLKGLIIAPTCSLSTNVSPYLLEAITAGVSGLARFNTDSKRNNTREVSKYPGMEREGGAGRFKKDDRIAEVSEEDEKRQFIKQLRAEGENLEADKTEKGDSSRSSAEYRLLAAAEPSPEAAPVSVNSEKRSDADQERLERIFTQDTDFAALAAEADSAESETKTENGAVGSGDVSVQEDGGSQLETANTAEAGGDSAEFMPPDVELDYIDDIYADDFDIADEDDDEQADDLDADSAVDKPRQAWKNTSNGYNEERFGSRDRRSERGREDSPRSRRQAQGERDRRSGYGERERRSGYGSRDGRDSRSGYGERERRGGYGSRDGRDSRSSYGERERRSSYGNRESRAGYNHDDGYAGHTSRDSGRKVIRIRRQK
ncbi:MAG: uroporphyrinogen decarboxylase family protein [bacterium]|nr:uroporphyrinogen decarboxylase family protein [bacterium]